MMTPGTNGDCENKQSEGAYYLWSTDVSKNEVSGVTTGASASSMGALPRDLVIPYAVRLGIRNCRGELMFDGIRMLLCIIQGDRLHLGQVFFNMLS